MRRDVELKERKWWSLRTNSTITGTDQGSDFRKGFGLGVLFEPLAIFNFNYVELHSLATIFFLWSSTWTEGLLHG